MRIEEALAQCRGLCDFPALVDALGGEPRYSELSPEGWLGSAAGRTGVSAAADVGRFGSLPCVAVVALDPERAAERIARRLARRGDPTLLIVLGPPPSTLTFATGLEPPSVLTLDPAAPDGAALASLRRIGDLVEGGPTAVALRFAERLSGRRVDQRFFAAFRDIRDRLASEGPASAPPDERRALALLQLTRVLFLYFIQHKGWLDGRSDFLARAVDIHLGQGRSLARDLLRPLFFGLLNRPERDRAISVRRFGQVPFLNGGLFEPHSLERRWRFDHSNDSWRTAFDELFERFHFTLDERGDGASIAPDMLGRVFEGLMATGERKATGTFYTPSRLVDSLVAAGAASVVAERLGIDHAAAITLVNARAPDAARSLSRCRVLDPAVGSGAFLLGALELFTRLEDVRDPVPGHRRRILRERLYGVDLSSEAVRLAELRLWLAAVQQDPDGPGTGVEPLPNLDATLRQGDTLHDPRWLAGLRRTPRATARELAQARHRFGQESGPRKREAWRELRTTEQRAAAEALTEAGRDLDERIAVILADARTPDLFGARRGLDPALRGALRQAREDRQRIRDAARRLAREGALPWFDATSCFGEVFAERGGFDLVVGNPPWVRAEEIPRRTRELLAGRYRWWHGTGSKGFGHRPDLAVAFVERSLELVAPGGALAMLVPAKLATAGYGTPMRTALARDTALDQVIDLSASSSDSFAAVTYPLALVIRKRAPLRDQRIALDLAAKTTVAQAEWSGAPWILRMPGAGRVAEALRQRHPLLAGRVRIHLGVKCGHNAAYLEPPASVEAALVRPAVRGRDLDPFRVGSSVRLLYPHDRAGRPLTTLPPGALRHLKRFAGPLAARTDAGTGPWWSLYRTGPASAPHRVAWADLARRLKAVALPRKILPLNSCYFAVVSNANEANALTAWLNSSWIGILARLGADPARGGFARFNARTVGALPWPIAAGTDDRLSSFTPDHPHFEHHDALDQLVADHLGLDSRERRALRTVE